MKQIIDSSGIPVKGLFRSADGAIQVKSPDELSKYQKEIQLLNRVSELENKVDDIHAMLKLLIERK